MHYCVIILQLEECENITDFRAVISTEEYDFRFSCGVTKPVLRLQFSDKTKIIEAVCLHYTILNSLAELEQLRHGLAMQKFDCLMQSAPVIRKAFQHSSTVTADSIQDLYPASFSPFWVSVTYYMYIYHLQ